MRKLMAVVVGVTVLCGMTALAQTSAPGGGTPQGGPAVQGIPVEEQQIARAHNMAGILVRAIREGEHDAATWPLVSQALTDRTAMLQAELNRVGMLQALLTAAEGGNKSAIEAARQKLKTSTEAVVAAARTFTQDIGALRGHLGSERGANAGPGGTGTAAPQTAK